MIRFSLIFEKFRLQKKSNISSSGEMTMAKTAPVDLSLRANGENYQERRDEVETITSRIENSSSAVIGIGGVRGAGKSSLALKVLNQCGQKGYFAILIPSPTAYDPKEFLLTVYQNLAETLKLRLEHIFNDLDSFEEQSRKRQVRMRKALLIIYLGLFCGFGYLMLIDINAISLQTTKDRLQHQRDTLIVRIEDIYYDSHIARRKEPIKSDTNQVKSSSISGYKYRLDTSRLSSLNKAIVEVDKEMSFPNFLSPVNKKYSSFFIWMFPILIFIIGTMSFIYQRVIRKFNRTIFLLSKYPRETGLHRLTVEKLEWLIYQAKLSTSDEFSIPVSGISAKFNRGRQLEARPLSMPGITADFNLFMSDVTRTFGKAVVCIDELDKINKPDELEALLKGIKGIIGQQNTYYLLTVSEDAISKFTTRFRNERDLLESSFEEIYLLNRVDFELGKRIMLGPLYESKKDDSAVVLNCLLIWVFANGIPREIKRNLIVLDRIKLSFLSAAKFETWTVLLSYSVEALRSWAFVNNADEVAVFGLVKCLDLTSRTMPVGSLNFEQGVAWFRSLQIYYNQCFPVVETMVGQPAASTSNYKKALLEISLLCFCFVLLTLEFSEVEVKGRQIQKIFELLSYNYLYAADELEKLMSELHIGII
jgi:hypothetical protein